MLAMSEKKFAVNCGTRRWKTGHPGKAPEYA
jgi:hypothetical protein